MLRIWLGAIKARTFQVKAETTSLTLSHPIVPGYCSCWKGKIRAVTVWRVNESWGTLKSRIIWLPHTMHCSHVLAILMQSLLGEGGKNTSLGLRVHSEGTSGESRKGTFLIKAGAVTGFERVWGAARSWATNSVTWDSQGTSCTEWFWGGSRWIPHHFPPGTFQKRTFLTKNSSTSQNYYFFYSSFQHTNIKFPENRNCFLFPKGTHWDIAHTEDLVELDFFFFASRHLLVWATVLLFSPIFFLYQCISSFYFHP